MKKKILILILTFIIIIPISCKKKQESLYSLSEKKINILDKEITYPSIKDEIDDMLVSNINKSVEQIKKKYDVIPKVEYESFYNKKYVSYKISYKYNDENLLKTYTYDLENNKQVVFNDELIIKRINEYYNNEYVFKTSDKYFFKYIIDDDNLYIYPSKYLVKSKECIRINFEDEFISDQIEEQPSIKKYIAITFDDGPSCKTKEIVDMLETLEIKATFFILGANANIYKEELLYIDSHNHEIGNHSYTHPNFKNITVEEGLSEIEKTQEIIYSITKRYPRIFRFPYGSVNKKIVSKLDMPIILWSVDSLDWKYYDTNKIVNNVKKEITENGIMLFHDFKYYNKVAITKIVNDLKNSGYTFVTISELLELNGDDAMNNDIYFKKK